MVKLCFRSFKKNLPEEISHLVLGWNYASTLKKKSIKTIILEGEISQKIIIATLMMILATISKERSLL